MTQLSNNGTAIGGEVLDRPDTLAVLNEDRELAPQPMTSGSEVDVQISTAKRYPRSIAAVIRAAEAMVSYDVDTAAGCFYSLKRREQGGRNKPIEGPSIRMAEIVASCWGNLRCATRVVDVGDRMITAEAVCWDLERNVAVRQEVMRRITTKEGKRYGDDMIMVTGNAACSIALRNAIIRVVPQVWFKRLLALAQKVVRGDSQPLAVRREKCLSYFAAMGVDQPRLLARIRRSGIEEITPDDLVELYGEATAIREGETTIDDAFPSTEPPKGSAAKLSAELKTATKPAAVAEAPVPAPASVAAVEAVGDLPFQPNGAAPAVASTDSSGIRSLSRARDAIALWAESSGRDVPGVDDMDMALERYAIAIKFGPIKDWIEDQEKVEAFTARASASSVVWSRYLRKEVP